jgi:hypothetical protein
MTLIYLTQLLVCPGRIWIGVSVNCCVFVCCDFVRLVPVEIYLMDMSLVAADRSTNVYVNINMIICTPLYTLTLEGIINKLEEDVHYLWKSQREQFKSSLKAHLLLLQLNSSLRILRV